MIVVHVTHEAVEKIGGIGTVIEGLTTADAYAEKATRTILLGPLFTTDRPLEERLGDGGDVIYSSLDEVRPPEWRDKFSHVERTYDAGVIYGRRRLHEPYSGRIVEVEVLLVDVFHANKPRLDLFKGRLWEKFNIPSHEFQNTWEYEQYVRLAEPGLEALRIVGADGVDEPVLILAHEYMGMPTALKAVLDGRRNVRTVFYAHEVASVRPIVEKLPGHDTMFYNVLGRAETKDQTLEDVFPQVRENFKHPLVKAARYCDHVFAVGDHIASELKFLDSHFLRPGMIDLVYNGIPAEEITLSQKQHSRALLKEYARNLLGEEPTWIFTHVARPVLSKGIWRDLRVLHEMESLLAKRGETAAYFMLGTLGGTRRGRDVRHMEQTYDWPVNHEEGYPDLCGGEEVVGETFKIFNETHAASRAVLINQWGFSRQACGYHVPEEATIADLRRGTDLEFGLSVYEPFGISQFEPLSFGALCVVSNVCGCMGFAREAMGEKPSENIIEGNFLQLPARISLQEVLSLDIRRRDEIESLEARRLATIIIDRLPRTDEMVSRRLAEGCALARRMSWQRVVREYFLPSLDRAAREREDL
ncbi:MAG: hypothetical protein JXA11_10385 [Phycisphaerae bacterium]|nr:hypothetical protein [Phycisphaerae bacterium]